MRSRHFTALIVFALAGLGSRAQHAGLVGTWRGTSICADREHWPACNDEQVIYEARLKHRAPDTVTVSADKVVNGVRDNGSFRFDGRQPTLASTRSCGSTFHTGPTRPSWVRMLLPSLKRISKVPPTRRSTRATCGAECRCLSQ